MGKRDQNPFLGTFTFHCGDLPPENIPEAVKYLTLKGLFQLSKEGKSDIDLSGYELVPFQEVIKK